MFGYGVKMKKIILLFCVVLVFGLHASSKHILVLQSYNKGLVWSDNISKGIEDILLHQKHYELTTEYMDTKKINNKKYLEFLYNLFYMKMRNQSFDAIIAVDNDAVEFVFKYKDTLFKNTPLIFCGIDKRDPGLNIKKILDAQIALVLESKEIKINIDFILKTLPKLKQLYVINDYTAASVLVNHTYENEVKRLNKQGIKATLSLDGNLKKIQKDILNLPANSAVLFGSLFRDKQGKYVPYYEINDILNSSKVPVFSISDSHFGKGVIGGYLLEGYDLGKQTAQETVKILENGLRQPNIPIVVPSKWEFDYKALKKYHIRLSAIPKEAIIINLPQTFFEKNKQLVEYAFILFPILLISLVFAIINNYQKYKLSKKLKLQSELQAVLLNNIQSSIFWIDKEGKIKGCNNSFCQLLKLPIEQILGQKICKLSKFFCDIPLQDSIEKLKEIELHVQKRIYRLRSQTFLDDKGEDEGIVSILVDITEKKQLELNTQFIIQQSKLAEIGEILSAIVHQWKNPLVELSAVAHKIIYYNKKGKLTSQNVEEFYNNIMKQIIYMSDTIDGFRDFIRPSNKPMNFDVDKGLQDILSLLSHSLKYTAIDFEYKNEAKSHSLAYGYPNEFKQVIVSIINNARDAIVERKEKFSGLSGLISLRLSCEKEIIRISIQDNGIGIHTLLKEKLFKPFFTTKTKGDGFGLYMAKLIIENKMHGKIDINDITEGTQICIEIPTYESTSE
jgi:signal transduction histidine kinase/ABC-type uncharacterized transport system substrate-binding protein